MRPFWSGTITFGLVSIPVELLAAVRPRQKSMKLVDREGHPLGRRYQCSKDGKTLSDDELVRGYETEDGQTIVITDEEFDALAPEMSRDIELKRFVAAGEISPLYFQRPYYLAPSGRSSKAYHLLAQTMARTGRVGVGSFVMRGREYLVAIVSDNGVLRAQTLRHADEVRTPDAVELPKRKKPAKAMIDRFAKAIEAAMNPELNTSLLQDQEAQALQTLAQRKHEAGRDVINQTGLEDEDADAQGAQVIDLMAVLRKSLSRTAVVQSAANAEPASVTQLADRRRATSPAPQPATKRALSKTTRKKTTPRRSANISDDSPKADLLKRAAALKIPGRAKMDKAALLKAIKRAS